MVVRNQTDENQSHDAGIEKRAGKISARTGGHFMTGKDSSELLAPICGMTLFVIVVIAAFVEALG